MTSTGPAHRLHEPSDCRSASRRQRDVVTAEVHPHRLCRCDALEDAKRQLKARILGSGDVTNRTGIMFTLYRVMLPVNEYLERIFIASGYRGRRQ